MNLTHEQRRAHVHGSEVAAILGVNPYCTPEQVRLEKLGRITPFSGNEQTEFGNLLEPLIAQKASERLGVEVRRQNHPIHNVKYPWLAGHIDRRIVGRRELLEVKTSSWFMSREWGEVETDEIPIYVLPQVHTYLLLLDFEAAHVAVYFGGTDLRLYTVNRDAEIDRLIIDKTKHFWEYHVKQDKPAPVKWDTPGAEQLIEKLYPGTNGRFIKFDLDHPANAWRDQLHTVSDQIRGLEKEKQRLDRLIRNAVGENSGAVFADGSGYDRKKVYRKAFTVEATSYYKLSENKNAAIRAALLGD